MHTHEWGRPIIYREASCKFTGILRYDCITCLLVHEGPENLEHLSTMHPEALEESNKYVYSEDTKRALKKLDIEGKAIGQFC